MDRPFNGYKCRIRIRHQSLIRAGEGTVSSICPVCNDGILPMRRSMAADLLPDDICLLCGQRVRYVDIVLGLKYLKYIENDKTQDIKKA